MKYTALIVRQTMFVLLTAMAARSHAASLLFDFGPTTVASTEAALSMGHYAGAVPGTELTWNKVINADIGAGGLVYSDGTAATGVSLTVGRSGFGSTDTVNFTLKTITSSALGGQETWGIYTNTSPLKDGIFATGTTGVYTNALGLRIDGLAAGVYTLYISGRNTSTAADKASMRFFARTGPSATSFTFSTNTMSWADEANSGSVGAPNQADAITSTFAYGDNCALLVVTNNPGDSLFLASTGTGVEGRGFLNAVEIVPGQPVLTNFIATIGVQPASVTTYEGRVATFGNPKAGGMPPLSYQWYFEGTPLITATNSTLTLSNVTPSMAGNYTVSVSNQVGTALSSNAVLTVIPAFNTGQMSNIWSLLPGSRFYLTSTDGGERGIAYNQATSNLLLVCHVPSNNIVVLDPATGAEKSFLDLTGVPAGAGGVNMVRVADDGVVYTCNATANAESSSTPFMLYRWDNDAPSASPSLLSAVVFPTGTGLRWGDNLAVRGTGADTQLLTASGNSTNICIFKADGTPVIIPVTGVPSGFAQWGVAFGPGTNTFWAKAANQPLYLVQFDVDAQTASAVSTYTNVPGGFKLISTDQANKWMAGIMRVSAGLPDNVRLYNISDLTNGPALADQELYPTNVTHGLLGGVGIGATAFGGSNLYALDENNGIMAFHINTSIAPLVSFAIHNIRAIGANVVLSWDTVAGHIYQVQTLTDLANGAWTDVGSAVTGNGGTASVTNAASGASSFYRIRGN